MPVRAVEMTTVCEYRCRPKILSLAGGTGNNNNGSSNDGKDSGGDSRAGIRATVPTKQDREDREDREDGGDGENRVVGGDGAKSREYGYKKEVNREGW